jgi:glutaryl-CoA dehydrogenase
MMTTAAPTVPAPTDLLDLDSLLGDEVRDLRDTVRRYVRNELLPRVPEWWEAGRIDPGVGRELGKLGLLGMHLDGYGLTDAGALAYGMVCLELEAGDSGLRSFVSVQSSLSMTAIYRFGSDEQKGEWLPRMASGEALGAFGLTEPDSGSDPGSMRTHARRDGDDWILNGAKMWITNGTVADVAIVWARTEDGVRGFLVPAGTPGFAAVDIHRKLSLRASITSELILDECRLPASAQLPGAESLRAPLTCLGQARFGIVFGAIGAARSCLEAAVDYARTRRQFGREIGSFQLTQRKLAEMQVRVAEGTLLAIHLARLKDAGTLRPEQVSVGKLANTTAALAVARDARSIHGANGITLEYPVMRHMLNLESVYTYEGTAEIHQLVIGQALTGDGAFR